MNVARRMPSAALMGDKLWITGGAHGDYTGLTSTEVIDLESGTITDGPQLPNGRWGHCMVALNDNLIMVLGTEWIKPRDQSTLIYNVSY